MTDPTEDPRALRSAAVERLALGLDLPPEMIGAGAGWLSPSETIQELVDSGYSFAWEAPADTVYALDAASRAQFEAFAFAAAGMVSRAMGIPMSLLGYPSFLDARYRRRQRARVKRKGRR